MNSSFNKVLEWAMDKGVAVVALVFVAYAGWRGFPYAWEQFRDYQNAQNYATQETLKSLAETIENKHSESLKLMRADNKELLQAIITKDRTVVLKVQKDGTLIDAAKSVDHLEEEPQ